MTRAKTHKSAWKRRRDVVVTEHRKTKIMIFNSRSAGSAEFSGQSEKAWLMPSQAVKARRIPLNVVSRTRPNSPCQKKATKVTPAITMFSGSWPAR